MTLSYEDGSIATLEYLLLQAQRNFLLKNVEIHSMKNHYLLMICNP
jgi:hypothetical protein